MSSLAGLRSDETHQRSDEYLEQSPDQHTADDEHGKDERPARGEGRTATQ